MKIDEIIEEIMEIESLISIANKKIITIIKATGETTYLKDASINLNQVEGYLALVRGDCEDKLSLQELDEAKIKERESILGDKTIKS